MRGLMMDRPLLIQSLIRYAARYHAETELVSRTTEGPLHRYTYADAEPRAKQLAKALMRLGVGFGDRVATIAWNNHRHFEAYYAISGMGAVCHTINPRLFADQLAYIVNHGEDKVLLLDLTFVPLAEKMTASWPAVRHYVVMTDRSHMPATSLPNVLCYEDIVAGEIAELEWPEFDENTAAALCYTSGTTGNPKGALYSHRSTVLHSLALCASNNVGIAMQDVLCPIVPMFHVNAWGVPYAAAMAGAKLVFPGPRLDGASLHELFDREGVTCALGVPTVWLGLLQHLEATGKRIDSVKRVTCGGSAVPISMIRTFAERYGVTLIHGWGMTEMSPVGSLSRRQAPPRGRDHERRAAGARTLGHRCLLPGRSGQPSCARLRWLVSHRRRGDDRCRWLHADRRPQQGRDQIRRRVDQLDRPRKRGDGPSRCRRGGGNRPAASKMGRAAFARRRGQARLRACCGRGHRLSRGQGCEMAAAR